MATASKKSKTPKSKDARRSSSVPASYRGFSYQGTRFLVHLLKSPPGSCVCLEVFEDVSVELPSGDRVAEQNKSYLSRNPLSTRAPSLWKSLRSWVEEACAERLDPATTFFILCAPGATPCEIAKRFHDAKSTKEAEEAIQFAKKELAAATTDDGSPSSDIGFVFKNLEALSKVIVQLSIETPLIDADEVKPLMLARLVSEDAYEDIVRWAHGWVKKHVDAELSRSRPARVKVDDFHQALLNYVRTHDRLDILKSYAGTPKTEEVKNELAVRDYVRQLHLITLEVDGVLEAVNDYLRAVIDRTNWAERGFIDESALDSFATDLTSTWRNIRRRTGLTHNEKPEETQGQLLYSECMEHRAKLDGYEPPAHFVKGSFHALSDDRSIGWHPRYGQLLPGKNTTPSTETKAEK